MRVQKGKPNLRLRDERLRHHWSQQELADQIGATLNTVSRWERGLTECSPYFRNKLCELFGKDARHLGLVADLQHEPTPPTVCDPLLPAAGKLVGREALVSQLREEICALQGGGIFALIGMPGAGKSALALALAHDPAIRERFHDGILWAEVGLQANLPAIVSRWGGLLGVEAGETGEQAAREAWLPAVRRAIGTRRLLILLDNIWRLEDAMVLLHAGGPYCSYLLTTRFLNLALPTAGEHTISVPELSEAQGLQVLERLAPAVVKTEPEHARRLVQMVGGLPLALVLIGQYLRLEAHNRQPRRLQLALEWLYSPEKRLQLEQPQVALEQPRVYSTRSLQAAIASSERQVSPQAREALRGLAVFPARPSTFSEQAALAVTGARVEVLDQLSDAGLLESQGPDRYSLQRCIADYAGVQTDKQQGERRLAEYFAAGIESYHAFEQERINVCAGLLYAYKHRLQAERERLAATFFRYQDFWTPEELGREMLIALSPYLKLVEDFEAWSRVCEHLGKGQWGSPGSGQCQRDGGQCASEVLTNLASAR